MLLEIGQKVCPHPFYINSRQNRQNMAERDLSRGAGEKTRQDCWTLMTRAEKVLLFFLILAIATLIGLSTFIIIHFLEEQDCDTHECVKASYELLKTVDFETDPCTDFREFICGNFEHIPVYEEKKVDLVTDDPHVDDSVELQTVKKFYQTCINTTAIEEDSEEILKTLISQIGGWPLLMGGDWKEENFNWLRFMVLARPKGVRTDWLLRFDYYEDQESGTNLLKIGPPKLKPTSYQFKTNFYTESITQLAAKLGSTEFVQVQLNQMMHFEANLSRISENARHKVGDSTKITTVGTMNEIWPDILLFEILNNLGRGFAVFTNNTLIVVASENYIYELDKLLAAVPKRTQANYLIWKIIENYLPFLTDDIRETYARYYKLESREEHCHAETLRRFHSVIEDEYVKKYKSENTLSMLEAMGNLIYQSYNESEEAEVDVVVDGPEGKDSGVTSIDFKSNKIIGMINEVQFHIENEFYKCLHREFDKCVKEGYYEDTEMLITYFDSWDDTIHLPYNLVYSDSFKWDRPNYINFAKIGRIIGDKIIEAEEEKYNTSIDVVGVNLAYGGYTQWVQKYGKDNKLPALNYTIKQLFWMYSGVPYCSSKNDSDKFAEIESSQHFKEDFSCM